jgi:methylmalonyl-CoA mutase
MADEVKLASGFPAADEAVWVRLVEKALDGKSPDRLTSKTEHGLPVKALYRETDWASRADASGAPGETPFVRGSSAERDPYLPWDIRQTIAQPDPALAAHEAMEALEGGVSSIELRIDVEGRQGIAVGGRCDLAHVLADVRLDLAPVALETTGASAGTGFGVAALLASVAAARGTQDVRLAFNLDPIGALVRTCALPGGSGALAETAAFARDAAIEFGGSRILRIDARPVHEAGGTEVQELAFLAAAAAEYLRVLITAGAPASAAARMILGAVSVGADYHLEIAKLRAARRILSRITGAFGATGADAAIPIQAVTARRMLAQRDPWTNLLRNTAACFAAGVGGADIVTVRPFTDAIGRPGSLARRMARNTQIIAQEESLLGVVVDPPGGAWAFEKLGLDIAEAAWTLFQSIEAEGGLVRALVNGGFQAGVAEARKARQSAVARRKEWITGVNDFPQLAETPVDAEPFPETGSPAAGSTSGPTPASPAWSDRRRAADAGAGLHALEAGGDDELEADPLWPIRLAEPYERLRDRAEAKAMAGAPMKVFLAAVGPLAEHSARLTFAQNFFATGGVGDVSGSGDADAIVAAFRASGCRLACLCGSDKRYARDGTVMAKALKAAGAGRIYLAGRGGEIEADLRAAGVEEFIFVGVDVLASLEKAHAELGL